MLPNIVWEDQLIEPIKTKINNLLSKYETVQNKDQKSEKKIYNKLV